MYKLLIRTQMRLEQRPWPYLILNLLNPLTHQSRYLPMSLPNFCPWIDLGKLGRLFQ